MAPLFLSSAQALPLSILSLFLFSLQLLYLSQPSSSSFVAHSNDSYALCSHHQKAALLQLKNGFSIYRGFYENSSSRLDSWNQATDCCSWEGIICDAATGLVIELNLSRNIYDVKSSWIEGQIDSSLFHLWSLQKLDLSFNNFSPYPIPLGLGHLTNLTHLNLSDCGFVGQIPLEMSQPTKLISLDLSNNFALKIKNPNLITLFGNFSSLEELFLDYVNISNHGGEGVRALSSALPNLHKLSLRDCGFVGQISLEGISQLTKLVSLDLSENFGLEIKFSNIAALFGNLSNLEELFLDYVNISEHGGEWAYALSYALPNLRILSLRYCGLSGPSNRSLFEVPFLSQLSLDGNNLSLNAMLNLLDKSSSLTSLTLTNCGLCGMFSERVFLMPNLQTLDISRNPLLTIDLPEFPKYSAFRILRMDNTNIQEKLLDSIGNLKFLEELSLSNCNLSGILPPSIANLSHLMKLDLFSNNFKSPIPSHLFSHPSLYYLDLGNNHFDSLPDDIQNASSSLTIFYLDGNKFQGPIPSIIYILVEIQTLYLSYNNFSGTVELLNMFQSFKNLRSLGLSSNSLSVINNLTGPNLISSPPIQSLSLSSCNINEFPRILRNLKQLWHLDLSNNRIQGEMPSWIWKVGNGTLYHLNLSHNFLESFEQPMLDLSFSQLHHIDLHSNRLQGSIPSMPPSVWFQDYSKNNFSSIVPHETNLTFVYFFSLFDNNISGEIPLSVCNARNLQILDLSSNKFSGRIPECLGEISDSLEILNLQKNSFRGMMPRSFKKGCTLRTLNVQENQLEGLLPRSLSNCKNLKVLDLGNNQINDTFPFLLEELSQLRILILRCNKFHGPIAHSHMNYPLFPFLQIFDISSNHFLGLFPSNLFLNWKAMMGDASQLGSNNKIIGHQLLSLSGVYYQDSVTLTMKGLDIEVVNIWTALISIDLSNNRFEGIIEESIGNLKLLCALNFSQNNFIGPIPPSLGNLTHLESLDLSRNKLSGEIPRQLLNLTFLAVLNLSQNLLIGSIPQGQQFSTFTNDSFLGNRGLCGLPLSTKCEDTRASSPSDFESLGSNKYGEINWRMMCIGFGVGFGVGLGVVFWTLVLWRKGSRK